MKRYTVKPPQGITSLGSKYGVIQDVMDKPNELFKLFDKLGAYEDTGLEPEEIMDGKMLTGWIPVEERLPPEPKVGMVDFDGIEDYIVMIEGAVKPTFLAYVGDGEWYRDGAFYRVISWMPLPEPYRPEN